MNIAVVGATGLVGRTMLRVLAERNVPVTSLRLFASTRSAGEVVNWQGTDYTVESLDNDARLGGIDVALFSAGGAISREWAPRFAAKGAVAIDNSSCWRMDPNVPLVVPEVNPQDAHMHKGIIANPNCSTIQMVVALKPLHDAATLRRVVASTYQSVSGAGQSGVDQLVAEIAGEVPEKRISPHKLAYNAVFHSFAPGEVWSEEEVKMVRETRRIMHLPDLRIAVNCVRVPVLGGHAEMVSVETQEHLGADTARRILAAAPGIVVMDQPDADIYPMPSIAMDTDPVYVGRIREDASTDNGLMMWVVSDNLRKGAATNAVQILELLART